VLGALGELDLTLAEQPSDDELAAFVCCKSLFDTELPGPMTILCAKAMFSLTCRLGCIPLLPYSADIIRRAIQLTSDWVAVLREDGACEATIQASAAVFLIYGHHKHDACPKTPPELRGPSDEAVTKTLETSVQAISSVGEENAVGFFTTIVSQGMLNTDDIVLDCGRAYMCFGLMFCYPDVRIKAEELGLFAAGAALHRRVEPDPLPPSWWIDTASKMDCTAFFLCCVWGLYGGTLQILRPDSRILPPLDIQRAAFKLVSQLITTTPAEGADMLSLSSLHSTANALLCYILTVACETAFRSR
jgi:hypothetical protein